MLRKQIDIYQKIKLTYINRSSSGVATERIMKQFLIFDINGHLVRQLNLTGEINSAQLNLCQVQSGDYIIKIITQEGVAVKRIMKLY